MESRELCLYLDLIPGEKADLEAISRAVLALSAALHNAAYILEPSSSIRIELVSGNEGSLSLNSIIKVITNKTTIKKGIGGALTALAIGWIQKEGPNWLIEKGLDYVVEHFIMKDESISRDEAIKIFEDAVKVADEKNNREHIKDFYKELSGDPFINGVGATDQHGIKPESLVNRSQIEKRASTELESPENLSTRTRPFRDIKITVIMPNLIAEPKKWRVIGPDGDHWALMIDLNFLDDMKNGRTNITFGSEIELDVDFLIIEELLDGAWQPKDRHIIKVHKARNKNQLNLGLDRPKQEKETDDSSEERN
jgi:hypothetical protein